MPVILLRSGREHTGSDPRKYRLTDLFISVTNKQLPRSASSESGPVVSYIYDKSLPAYYLARRFPYVFTGIVWYREPSQPRV